MSAGFAQNVTVNNLNSPALPRVLKSALATSTPLPTRFDSGVAAEESAAAPSARALRFFAASVGVDITLLNADRLS